MLLPKGLFLKNKSLINFVIIAHAIFLVFITCHYFVLNGIKNHELKKMNLIKSNYSLIKTHVDKRKNNIFYSSPDYFLKLNQLIPEVDAILAPFQDEASFEYLDSGKPHTLAKEVTISLVGNKYFEAFEGRFISGRAFNKDEVIGGNPVVIVGKKFLTNIFGDTQTHVSTINIKGITFNVIGVWEFSIEDIDENNYIYLPISTLSLFGKSNSTYINNFILEGNDSKKLLQLKSAIDKMQLDAGLQVIRPEFSFVGLSPSKKTETIFVHNKVYIDVIIWILLFIFIYVLFSLISDLISNNQSWVIWILMSGKSRKAILEFSENFIYSTFTTSIIIAFLINIIVLLSLNSLYGYEFVVGDIIHPSIVLYVFSLILFHFFIRHKTYQIVN